MPLHLAQVLMPCFNIAWLSGLLLDWVLNFMAWFGEVCNLVIWRALPFDCSSAGLGFAVPVSPLEVCYDTWRAREKACLLPFLYSLLTSWFFQLCTGKQASLWSFYKGPSSPPFPQPQLLSIISSRGIVLYSLKISLLLLVLWELTISRACLQIGFSLPHCWG